MGKKDPEVWEIIIEAITAVAVCVFFGLQIYYAYIYECGILTMFYHLAPVVLLYVGMTVLQIYPELLNGSSEVLQEAVRMYAVRMVRNSKLLLIVGVLAPSIADAISVEMNAAYSLFIMVGVIGTIGYYIFRIYRYNSSSKK